MNLYFSPGACSFAPHIVMNELGMPVNLVKVDMASKITATGEDFTKINPNGYVPAIKLDDGSILTEGVAIMQYLADKKPEAELVPKFGTMERYRLMEMMNFLTTEIHKGYSPLFGASHMVKGEEAVVQLKEFTKTKLAKRFGHLSVILSDRPYLMGDKMTIADVYLFTILRWSGAVHVDLKPFAKLVEFVKRMTDRPSVQAAIKAEGLKH